MNYLVYYVYRCMLLYKMKIDIFNNEVVYCYKSPPPVVKFNKLFTSANMFYKTYGIRK